MHYKVMIKSQGNNEDVVLCIELYICFLTKVKWPNI